MSSNDGQPINSLATAEAPDATGVFPIWPDGAAPGSEDWTWAPRTMTIPWAATSRRMTRNVVVPTLTLFRPRPERANGTSMIIAPGGAFHFLMIDHEGYDMALWLAERGVTALVLKYRLERSPDADADVLVFRNALQKRLGEARIDATEPPDGEIPPPVCCRTPGSTCSTAGSGPAA